MQKSDVNRVVSEAEARVSDANKGRFRDAVDEVLHAIASIGEHGIGANSVIFGALLSAYAGINLSKLNENLITASLLVIMCILHAILLACINLLTHNLRGSRLGIKKYLYSSVFLSGLFASFIWHDLFGSFTFYTAILLGWIISSVVVGTVVSSLERPFGELMARIDHRNQTVRQCIESSAVALPPPNDIDDE